MTFSQLFEELNTLDEHSHLEAKGCDSGTAGSGIYETICSFSNEPSMGGGYLLLGVKRSDDDLFQYDVIGVDKPDQLQSDIATACESKYNLPVRPRITTETYEGKNVIVIKVEELPPIQKPLYLAKKKLPQGAFRRIGSTDQHCTDEDLAALYETRRGDSYDLTILSNADIADDFDPGAIQHYRKLRKKANAAAEELNWEDQDLLEALNAIRKEDGVWKPTLTGLLLFGSRKAHRRELPAVRADYIRVPGKQWISDPDDRFVTTDMRGPLLQLVERVLATVMDDLPRGFELEEGQAQANTPTLPARALREAIVNALMHRSYRVHQPTQIIRYSNRIEIRNAGFSLKNEEFLGNPGSMQRNPNLAEVFHETNMAETKGAGVRVMREKMSQNGFSLPTFESNRGENFFVIRLLLHHFLSDRDLKWLSQVEEELSESQRYALIFLREQGAIDNQTLRQLTGDERIRVSTDLRKLRDLDFIAQKGKGNATYYERGKNFPAELDGDHVPLESEHMSLESAHMSLESAHMSLESEHMSLEDEHMSLEDEHMSLEGEHMSLPDELLERIKNLGARPGDKIRPIIVDLCKIRPFSANELAEILSRRDSLSLKRAHIKPMVDTGVLKQLYDMERHPKQAYVTKDNQTTDSDEN